MITFSVRNQICLMRQEHSRYFCELKVPINDQLNGVMTWLD